VASFSSLTHAYGDRILFLGADLEVERGDHIALVGPNGAGKSTLLRLLMGIDRPLEGQAALGEHNVIPAHFEQNQAEALDLDQQVLAMVFEAVPDWTQSQVRSFLGRFGFSNEAVFKEAGMLSGGEKARLALALLLLRPSNLLLLDEPTNHLDIPAKRMLEEALSGYEGAVLLVSHDRAFVSKVANRIVELRDGELILYRGDFAYYQAKKREEALEQQRLREEKARMAKREANRQRQRNRDGRDRSASVGKT
jgi:ATP-binding cassette subfamily F protein 3